MAKYHEICRFTDDGTYDHDAALFHLKCAADCGIIAAKTSLAKMYYGMPHDILAELDPPEPEAERKNLGYKYMLSAAQSGDRSSMVFIARAFDSGLNLDSNLEKSAKVAMEWFEKISIKDEMEGDNTDWGMDDPPYMLLARQAEMWLEGENIGLDKKDPNLAGELYNQAAESAMACMKGKLANKYYMLAEEAYGQCEEDEE